MTEIHKMEVPIKGMDCADCTRHVQQAISQTPGVRSVEVFLSSEKAVVHLDSDLVDLSAIRKAVAQAGYRVPEESEDDSSPFPVSDFTRSILTLLGLVFGAVLFVVVVGEWLGLFAAITARVPFLLGLAIVLIAGYPVFKKVIKAALNRQIISHTLMTAGVLAALAIGEWATAAVVVFFMRVGDYVENFTAERARRAVKDLAALAPQTARVEREGQEMEIPIEDVEIGDHVFVRPGEKIPVDGEVIRGHTTIDQAAITGESMPFEAGPGAKVYAATFAQLGSLRVRATATGEDTTFGRVIKLVEEAEAHRAAVQRVADKFSAYYLPIVAGIAALTFLIRRDPLATAAVLVVACSCSFALATPIAMLASIGAGARRGLMIKGGKYIETLARADVLLIDKTGTLTLGKPQITDIVDLRLRANFVRPIADLTSRSSQSSISDQQSPIPNQQSKINNEQSKILFLAASAERYSEHPLAQAVRSAAVQHGISLAEPAGFEAIPGQGVRARINGTVVTVGSKKILALSNDGRPGEAPLADHLPPIAEDLKNQGKTLLYLAIDGHLSGIIAATDTLRDEVPQALEALRSLGIQKIELLTGDNPKTAAAIAGPLGVAYRAGLLPEDKIAIVKDYQASGHIVVMVGDGVNDAPALAQADIGIAMGAAGSDIAIEAAHIALMREDWTLIPQLLSIARRTMRIVHTNIAFTAVYNLAGLTLAALGFLPPIFAAAAQSLPDLGILANSSRLLRQK
jgi:Cu+-exporting ATPase